MTIYSKTAKGMREASGKTKNLTSELRGLLKLVNGKATLDDLRKQLDDADQDALEPCILSLVEEEYIHELEGSNLAPSPPPLPPKAAQKTAPTKPAPEPVVDESGGDLDFFAMPAATPPAAPVVPPAQTKQMEAAAKAAKAEAEEKALREALDKARVAAQEKLKQAALAEQRAAAEAKTRREAEEKVQRDAQEKLRREVEEKAKLAAAELKRVEAEAVAKRQAEERAKRAAQDKAEHERRVKAEHEQQERQRAEAAEALAAKARSEAEERLRREEAEIVRRETEEKAKREAADRLRIEAGERAKKAFEEKARREAEDKLKRDAQETARREEVERLRMETEQLRAEVERQRIEAAAKDKLDAEEKVRLAAEERVRREAAELAQAEEAERQRLMVVAKAVQDAEEKLRRDVAEKLQREEAERARLEAGAAARIEAEKAAQREVEAKAKRDAEDKLQREADEKRRIEADALAKRDADERTRQAAAEKLRADAVVAEQLAEQQKQQVESEQKALAEAQSRDRSEADERARIEAEEAKWRAEERGRRETEAQLEREHVKREESERAARQATAQRRGGKPGNWGKRIAFALIFLLVGGLGLIHVLPFDGQKVVFEQAASAQFRQSVKIKSLHFALVPQVHWRADDVSIGDGGQIRIASIRGGTSVGALFAKDGVISALLLDTVTVSEEGLSWLLFGKPQQGGLVLPKVVATNVKLNSNQLLLPPVDLSAELGADGQWQKLLAQSADRKFLAELERAADGVKLKLESAGYAPPSAFSSEAVTKAQSLSLTDFRALGTVSEKQLTVSEFSGGAFDGMIAGSARMTWDDGILLSSDLSAKRIGIASLLPTLFEMGTLNGNGSFVMSGTDLATQRKSVRGDGNFLVERGELRRVDLGKVLQGGSSSGKTAFSTMGGRFVYGEGKTQINGVKLFADLLSASGNAELTAENTLGGRFVVELKSAKMAVKGNLSVSGSITEPQFSH